MQIDCDTAPWVRDKVPVFCEKRTEVVDNTCVTTRGCSVDYRWEDVRGYQDIRGGQVPSPGGRGRRPAGWGERLKDREEIGRGFTQCCDTKQNHIFEVTW